MTNQIDQIGDTDVDEIEENDGGAGRRRRLFLTGAGIAGAAAIVGKSGVAQAADGGPAFIGELNTGDAGATIFENTNADVTDPGTPGEEAIVGIVSVAANGSHAVKGVTNGAGHSIAGDTPAEAADGGGLPNFSAATWGRHGGPGAGIGGESAEGYGGEFIGGRAHIRLIQVDNSDVEINEDTAVIGPPTEGFHTLGELFADGTGALFYYQGDNNGGWTQINNQQRIFTDPQRAYDSREQAEPANENKGRFVAGETREIDLNEFTDFPTGAKAALVNITVTDTGPIGFLTAFNGDTGSDARPNTSSVTWGGPLQRVTNSLTVRTSELGTINIYTSEECSVVIDVSGWLD